MTGKMQRAQKRQKRASVPRVTQSKYAQSAPRVAPQLVSPISHEEGML